MPAFPTYARLLLAGASESFAPDVVRSEMERGLAKQRLQSARVLAKLKATVMLKSQDDVNAFLGWYFDDIKRIGFFDVVHPRTGQTVPMRFENGEISELTPQVGQFFVASCQVTLEYLR